VYDEDGGVVLARELEVVALITLQDITWIQMKGKGPNQSSNGHPFFLLSIKSTIGVSDNIAKYSITTTTIPSSNLFFLSFLPSFLTVSSL